MSTSLVNNLGGSAGFGENSLPPNDDSSSLWIDIRSVFPNGLNFFGTVWDGFYINNNGNITFGYSLHQYTPTAISANNGNPMIAAYFADVDTEGGPGGTTPGGTSTGTNLVWYDLDPSTGKITITWDDVGYFGEHTDKLNAFQMQIVRVGSNDFDVSFRYEDINWTTGDASNGQGGLGGSVARAGYSAGDGVNFFELPQSGNQAGMLDLENSSNGDQPGLWTFTIRSGVPVIEVSIQDAQQMEGNGPGTTTLQFEVHLSTASSETITVDWATEPGTASAADYQAGAGTVVFEPGQTVRTISVQIIGDTVVEPDETFFVRLSNPHVQGEDSPSNASQVAHAVVTEPNGPTNILNDNIELPISEGPPEAPPVQVVIGVGLATGTILNDDTAVLPSLSVNDVVVQEGDSGTTLATFTLSLSAASALAVSVDYATANGTAVAPGDYAGGSGSVTFAPGQTSAQVSVQIKGDTLNETDEAFRLLLTGAVNASLGKAQGTATIVNDDALPVLTVSSASTVEGTGAGTTELHFLFTLTQPAHDAVSVHYATSPGTALAGNDYTPASGTLTFAAGEVSKEIVVQVVRDADVEADESFKLVLSQLSGPAVLGNASADGTILNDDTAVLPSLSVNDVVVQEGDSGTTLATFTLSLSAASALAVSVDYATANGTAVAPGDYAGGSGSVTFAPGQTSAQVSVQIKGDTLNETDEAFQLLLTGAVNASLGKAQGTATIVNDDALPVLTVSSASTVEGTGAGTTELHFLFTLTQPAHDAVSVHYATSPGTALAGNDYTPASGTLTFAAGEVSKEIVVQVVRDADVEADESFKLVLSQLSGPAVLGNASADGTILNDDLPPPAGRDLLAAGMVRPLLGELGADTLTGGCGNDVLIGLAGDDLLRGCDGLDTAVFSASRENYQVTGLGDAWAVSDLAGTEGTDTLSGIERLQFADMNLALDVSGNAGQVWRLLSSAFNTAPDPAELGVWISAMDHGITLDQVASAIMGSARYISLHGSNPTDSQFVTDLYSSVLHRAPEAGRLDFWVSGLQSGAMNKTQVMLLFSESVEHMATVAPQIASGITYFRPNPFAGAAGDDVLIGTGGADTLTGGSGNDVLIGLGGSDQIDGGAGVDTAVYAAARADLAIVRDGGQITVTGSTGVDGTDSLTGVERLQLYDVNLAFDVDGSAGQIYRLYQAAFDRAPDLAGFGGWIYQMDHGLALAQVASAFVASAEFTSLYGAHPTDAQFVNLLYGNVLDRAPDTEGYDYWTYQLAHGMSRDQALVGFSESTENQVAMIGAIESGMAYLPA